MSNQNIEKLKKSRNITLLIAVIVSFSALMRWLGIYGDPNSILSPWLSTFFAIVLFISAAYKHRNLTKAQLNTKDDVLKKHK